MLLKETTQIKFSKHRAIIINVSTKWVTTLALLSALRYAEMPILVVDCESTDGSAAHFTELMKVYDFDLLAAPLKKHGATLDWLFATVPAEKILLVDSDVEILNSEIVRKMKNFIDRARVFGSGFVHGPNWLPDRRETGYYQERMWIPLTMLDVEYVRQALAAGYSFADKTIYNDFAASKFVSKILARRFRRSFSENWRLSWLDGFKDSYNGWKPCYVFCDTGASVFQYLKYRCELYFVGFPAELHEQYVTHFHGVTRSLLDSQDKNSTNLGDIGKQVRERLREIYGIEQD